MLSLAIQNRFLQALDEIQTNRCGRCADFIPFDETVIFVHCLKWCNKTKSVYSGHRSRILKSSVGYCDRRKIMTSMFTERNARCDLPPRDRRESIKKDIRVRYMRDDNGWAIYCSYAGTIIYQDYVPDTELYDNRVRSFYKNHINDFYEKYIEQEVIDSILSLRYIRS